MYSSYNTDLGGKMSTIKEWAEDDRPREKLMAKTPKALTNAELLAILIGSGTKNESAVDLAKKILASLDNQLARLARLSLKELVQFKGIGHAKAINIIAALELGRRRRLSEALDQKKIISSKDAFEILAPILNDRNYEEFWCVTLNRSNYVIKTIPISEGSIAGTVADPKKIFKLALEDNASSIIIAHNHPSGSLKPSNSDLKLTEKCKEAGKFLELPVIDHIIIGNDKYFSFADEGLI